MKQLLDLVFCYYYDDDEIYSLYRVQQIFMQNYAAFMWTIALHVLHKVIQGRPCNFPKFINIYERQYFMLSVLQIDAIVREK